MTLLQTLVTTIGISIAKSLVKVWLREYPVPEGASLGLLDIISANTTDLLSARDAARRFEQIGDRVALALQPVFASYQLKQPSYRAVAAEVSAAIDNTNVSARYLASLNYDPRRVKADLGKHRRASSRHFAEQEEALLDRSLDLAAQYIIDASPSLTDFAAGNFAEVLHRLDKTMSQVSSVLEGLDRLQAASSLPDADKKAREFERDYRAALIRRLDKVHLLGVDLSQITRRYQLSVAYVSLQVSASDNEPALSVEQALSKIERAAIVGEAGSGKTTLLQWLAVNSSGNSFPPEMARWAETIPFFIELRRFSDGPPPPESFVSRVVPEIADNMPTGWVSAVLKSGRAIVLVDGLDEVAPGRRDAVVQWLDALCGAYPKNRYVFTSRPPAYAEGLLRHVGFRDFTLAPMHMAQIEKFIEYWHKAVLLETGICSRDEARDLAEKLLRTLRANPPVLRLATNPLLCAMVCALHFDRHMHLPSDRNALYDACSAMLLDRRDTERELRIEQYPQLTLKQKRILLDDLAYWMLKNAYVSVHPLDALDRMKARITNMQFEFSSAAADDVLNSLIERSGIIRKPSEDTLDFIHRTFQEYMAASALALEGDWGLLLDHAKDDQWRDVLVLAAGFANRTHADRLVQGLTDQASRSPADRPYFDLLSVACLETAVEISPETRAIVEGRLAALIPPRVGRQYRSLAAAGDLAVPYLRNSAAYTEEEAAACIEVLAAIGTQAALNALATYATDQRPKVAAEFWEALDLASPDDVSASGLADALFGILASWKSPPAARLTGPLVNALALEPPEKWHAHLDSTITTVELVDCNSLTVAIGERLPHLTSAKLSGLLPDDLSILAGVEALVCLELSGGEEGFPRLIPLLPIQRLRCLRIQTLSQQWPDVSDLGNISSLQELEIRSDWGEDSPDLSELTCLKHVRSLHISADRAIWPDLAPLRELPKLTHLVLSTTAKRVPRTLLGIEDLAHVHLVTIWAPQIPQGYSVALDGLRALLPQSTVEIREGWSSGAWEHGATFAQLRQTKPQHAPP